ncbi:MAG: LysM domain-containing protein [Phycisphaerae bacterium]|jgi:hypothetical protein|nr:LysM domain-containing protein [Phycisphaerae bacterium]
MTRETRIGLLVGLGFIVLFGVVLSELSAPMRQAPKNQPLRQDEEFYAQSPLVPLMPEIPRRSRQVTLIAKGQRSERAAPPIRVARPPAGPVRTLTAVHAVGSSRSDYVEMTPEQLVRANARARGGRRRTYVTRRGDTLTRIARRFLRSDSRSAVMKIFNANRSKLGSPDALGVGVTLVIPN